MFQIPSSVNNDLLQERQKCTFNIEEFAIWWNGGEPNLKSKRIKENIFAEVQNENQHETPPSYLSHKQLYEYSVKKSVYLLQKLKQTLPHIELKIGNYAESLDSLREVVALMEGVNALSEGYPFSVHFSMFLPTILSQGTLNQQAEWVTKAWNMEIIGTYAQTELGHGTFLRGLETRADFDPRKDEFILNSPTKSSFKWWPGGLGHTANFAIVVAQLYTRGIHRGLYAFITQLRDLETHKPLPGVIIGEIGPRLGMKGVNNGFLGFKSYRIPRKNMLMKNARVFSGGAFEKSPTTILTYGTMVFVRVLIAKSASTLLAYATIIATRYSAIRRQSPIDPNKPDSQIIDHVTQQLKLFPNISKAVIFKIVANKVWEVYNEVTKEVGQGQLHRLPELHALSCCLKAVCSADSAAGVETCRQACGGHGYMTASNFPALYGFATAACTYEGENTVLLLQTARYLIKAWRAALNDEELMPTVVYLAKHVTETVPPKWSWTHSGIIEALQFSTARKVSLAFENIEKRKIDGKGPELATSLSSIELVQAATLHCRCYMVMVGYEELNALSRKLPATLHAVLCLLFDLFVVDTCFTCLSDLLRFSCLDEGDVNRLQKKLEEILYELRENAVGIVDGFDVPDVILNSCLGAYDGNVYERIYDEAMKNPLNMQPVNETFFSCLKPMMKANL